MGDGGRHRTYSRECMYLCVKNKSKNDDGWGEGEGEGGLELNGME